MIDCQLGIIQRCYIIEPWVLFCFQQPSISSCHQHGRNAIVYCLKKKITKPFDGNPWQDFRPNDERQSKAKMFARYVKNKCFDISFMFQNLCSNCFIDWIKLSVKYYWDQHEWPTPAHESSHTDSCSTVKRHPTHHSRKASGKEPPLKISMPDFPHHDALRVRAAPQRG